MPFIYCQSCGSKMEYTINKPNFCSSCGASITGASAVAHQKEDLKPQEGDIEPSKIPNIRKLDIEIHTDSNLDITLGNTIGSGAIGLGRRSPHQSRTGDVTKDSLDFCKPSRSKDIDDSA